MPQQITISDVTWDRLKALAEPLIDTVDDVIIRLLDSSESTVFRILKREVLSGITPADRHTPLYQH